MFLPDFAQLWIFQNRVKSGILFYRIYKILSTKEDNRMQFISPLSALSHITEGESRSISAENFTGERGCGGMAEHGTGEGSARELGRGWKISPSVAIPPHTVFTLADIAGEGSIRHIWCADGSPFCACTGMTARYRASNARLATFSAPRPPTNSISRSFPPPSVSIRATE